MSNLPNIIFKLKLLIFIIVVYLPSSSEKRKTDIKEYPSLLSLLVRGSHNCGASIISEWWALTAAHCLEKCDSARDVILRSKSSRTEYGGKLHQAKQLIQHPKYNNFTVDYDFAVIKVLIPFRKYKATVLTRIEPQAGLFTSYGWGTVQVNRTKIYELSANDVELLDRKECSDSYRRFFTKRMICAGGNGEDSCQGDSGGPLIHKHTKVQVGIISWGRECGNAWQPGVYSNIADQIDWIRNVSGMKPLESIKKVIRTNMENQRKLQKLSDL